MKFLIALGFVGFVASAAALIPPPINIEESIKEDNVLSTSDVQRDVDDISIAPTRYVGNTLENPQVWIPPPPFAHMDPHFPLFYFEHRPEPEAAQDKTLDRRVMHQVQAQFPIDTTRFPNLPIAAVTIAFVMTKKMVTTATGLAERHVIRRLNLSNTSANTVWLRIVSRAGEVLLDWREIGSDMLRSIEEEAEHLSGRDVTVYVSEESPGP